MKQVVFILFFLFIAVDSFCQFSDTASLNAFIRDTIRDRRPDKRTAAQLQRALLGISHFLTSDADSLYSKKLVLNVKDFGATGNGTTDDAAAIQSVFDYITTTSNNYIVFFPPGTYKVSTPINLPGLLTNATRLKIEGYGAILTTTAAIAIFQRIPANDAAAQPMVSNWKGEIAGLTFTGNGTGGQKALYLGAFYQLNVHDCNFSNLDTAIDGRFWLHCKITNCQFAQNRSIAIYGAEGNWNGATLAGDTYNFNVLDGNRIYNYDGAVNPYAAIYIHGADQTVTRNTICEGGKPLYEYYYDYGGSTLVQTNTVDQWWSETVPTGSLTENTQFKIRVSGVFNIEHVQSTYKCKFFNFDNSGAASFINIKDFSFYQLSDTPFSAKSAGIYGLNISGQSKALFDTLNRADNWSGNALPGFTMSFIGATQFGNMISSTSSTEVGGHMDVNGELDANSYLVANSTIYANGYTYHGGTVFLDNAGITAQNANGSSILWSMQPYFPDSSLLIQNVKAGSFYTKWDKNGRWVFNTSNNLFVPSVSFHFVGTDAAAMPIGTTAQRPTGAASYLRFNSDSTNAPEYYDGGNWQSIASKNFVRTSFSGNQYSIPNYDGAGGLTQSTGFSYANLGNGDYVVRQYANINPTWSNWYGQSLSMNQRGYYTFNGWYMAHDFDSSTAYYRPANLLVQARNNKDALGDFLSRPGTMSAIELGSLGYGNIDWSLRDSTNTGLLSLMYYDGVRANNPPNKKAMYWDLVNKKIGLGSSTAYDFTNNRLGVGTTSPTYTLDVTGKGHFTDSLLGTNLNLTGNINLPTTVSSSTGVIQKANAPWIYNLGTYQIFFGEGVGNFSNTGMYNVFVGGLGTGSALTSGIGNVGIGINSMAAITSGLANVGIGLSAFSGLTTGNNNIGIGQSPGGSGLTTGSGNVLIGNQVLSAGSNISNTLAIDNSSTTTPLIYGRFDVDSVFLRGKVYASNSISIGTPGNRNDAYLVIQSNQGGAQKAAIQFKNFAADMAPTPIPNSLEPAPGKSLAYTDGLGTRRTFAVIDTVTGASGDWQLLFWNGNDPGTVISDASFKYDTRGPAIIASVPMTYNNSVTGSSTANSVSISPTWNTTGAPTALLINPTNTASGSLAKLLDVQVGNSSKFNISKTGTVTVPGFAGSGNVMVCADNTGAFFTQAITSVASGSYTPTLTDIANTSGSTANVFQWMRVGNVITVSGSITTTVAAATTLSRLGFTLPIASDFTSSSQCAGVCQSLFTTNVDRSGSIIGDATNDRAEMNWVTNGGVSGFTFTYYMQFTYTVL